MAPPHSAAGAPAPGALGGAPGAAGGRPRRAAKKKGRAEKELPDREGSPEAEAAGGAEHQLPLLGSSESECTSGESNTGLRKAARGGAGAGAPAGKAGAPPAAEAAAAEANPTTKHSKANKSNASASPTPSRQRSRSPQADGENSGEEDQSTRPAAGPRPAPARAGAKATGKAAGKAPAAGGKAGGGKAEGGGRAGAKKLARPEGTVNCPRCGSEQTKFCYYNNYNVNQPRYLCHSCMRYWTAGGTLRNVPVGSGKRKNKNLKGERLGTSKAAQAKPAPKVPGLVPAYGKPGAAAAPLSYSQVAAAAAAAKYPFPAKVEGGSTATHLTGGSKGSAQTEQAIPDARQGRAGPGPGSPGKARGPALRGKVTQLQPVDAAQTQAAAAYGQAYWGAAGGYPGAPPGYGFPGVAIPGFLPPGAPAAAPGGPEMVAYWQQWMQQMALFAAGLQAQQAGSPHAMAQAAAAAQAAVLQAQVAQAQAQAQAGPPQPQPKAAGGEGAAEISRAFQSVQVAPGAAPAAGLQPPTAAGATATAAAAKGRSKQAKAGKKPDGG